MLKLPLEAVHEYKTQKRGNYGWAVTHTFCIRAINTHQRHFKRKVSLAAL